MNKLVFERCVFISAEGYQAKDADDLRELRLIPYKILVSKIAESYFDPIFAIVGREWSDNPRPDKF